MSCAGDCSEAEAEVVSVVVDVVASGKVKIEIDQRYPLREAAQKVSKIKVLSIAGLLGSAIENIHMETSVSTLFS